MIEVTNVRNGAILNHSNGRETDEFLEFILEGVAEPAALVTVNRAATLRDGRRFSAPVRLTKKINDIVVIAKSKYGELQFSFCVLWDKKSFKRYNFYIDDNIFFLTDIAKERPKRLFDHFYPAMLRDMNKKYGTKFMLNIFYRNDHHPFELKDVPDIYKAEWKDNAQWLKLAFHSYSEMPQYAYRHCPLEKLLGDYDLIHDEIVRFAGEETFTPAEAIHWCMFHPNYIPHLVQRGVKVLSGWFIDSKTLCGQESAVRFTDLGYNNDIDNALYLENHNVFYDCDSGVFFNKNNICLNLTPLDEVEARMNAICANPVYNETMELYTHEQYSFNYYPGYLPDHAERIEAALRRAAELGYAPVFFNDGLLGNTAWEKEDNAALSSKR